MYITNNIFSLKFVLNFFFFNKEARVDGLNNAMKDNTSLKYILKNFTRSINF